MLLRFCLYLAAVNVVTFAIYAFDKEAARRGWSRISERTLLTLAFVGGAAGAVTAQQLLRHKTRKEPFRTWLLVICVLQPAALVLAYTYVQRL